MDLRLEGDLTIHDIARHHAGLLSTLSNFDDTELRLDLSGVGELDSAGVQILLSLRKFLARREARLVILESRAELGQVFQTYRLDAASLAPIGAGEADGAGR